MAYKIIDVEHCYGQNAVVNVEEIITAVLDSKDDLASLRTDYAPGSVAIVADKGAPAYMLNASGEWKEI